MKVQVVLELDMSDWILNTEEQKQYLLNELKQMRDLTVCWKWGEFNDVEIVSVGEFISGGRINEIYPRLRGKTSSTDP